MYIISISVLRAYIFMESSGFCDWGDRLGPDKIGNAGEGIGASDTTGITDDAGDSVGVTSRRYATGVQKY